MRKSSGLRAKSGKPRPGTGGQGRRRLEGKGPTPRAELRPGHPAQRQAKRQAKREGQPAQREGQPAQREGQPAQRERQPSQREGGTTREGRTTREGQRTREPRATGRSPRSGAEVVAGRNAVIESLRAAVPAVALHVGVHAPDERITEAVKLAADLGIPVVEAGRAELDRMTAGAVHQGVALRIRSYSYAHPDDLLTAGYAAGSAPGTAALIVALDGITDPRNLGAIARSVAAFGATGVLIPARRSAGVTAGAWKASAGALAHVRVAQAPNLARALAGYAAAGLFVVGLDASAGDEVGSLGLADGPLVLVVGSEGKGLSRLVAQQCDALARIPLSGAESLNASVAAGIALYQVSLLRRTPAG